MGAVTCTDPANTCERALCECTSRFAHSHTQHKHHYNQQEWVLTRFCHGMKEYLQSQQAIQFHLA